MSTEVAFVHMSQVGLLAIRIGDASVRRYLEHPLHASVLVVSSSRLALASRFGFGFVLAGPVAFRRSFVVLGWCFCLVFASGWLVVELEGFVGRELRRTLDFPAACCLY